MTETVSTDVFTPAERSAVMRRVKGKDTAPERFVRRILTDMGVRYRLNRRDLPGSPDIALGPRRLAIFVHGCFWHGHDCKRGARQPKQNADYWQAKIARNRLRDAAVQARLVTMGWKPLIVWECGLRDRASLETRLWEVLDERRQADSISASLASIPGPLSASETAA